MEKIGIHHSKNIDVLLVFWNSFSQLVQIGLYLSFCAQVAITDSPPQILAASGPFGGVMLVEVVTDKPTHTRQMLQSIVKKCG